MKDNDILVYIFDMPCFEYDATKSNAGKNIQCRIKNPNKLKQRQLSQAESAVSSDLLQIQQFYLFVHLTVLIK